MTPDSHHSLIPHYTKRVRACLSLTRYKTNLLCDAKPFRCFVRVHWRNFSLQLCTYLILCVCVALIMCCKVTRVFTVEIAMHFFFDLSRLFLLRAL